MRLVIVSILLILAIVVVVILYCSLIVASRIDEEMRTYFDSGQNVDKRGR